MFYFEISCILEREYVMAETVLAETYGGTKSPNVRAQRAFRLFRRAITIAPIAFGLDKLSEFLHGWGQNLGPWITDIVPGGGNAQALLTLGVVEMLAGLALAVLPHFFGDRAQAFVDPVVDLASDALTRLLS